LSSVEIALYGWVLNEKIFGDKYAQE